MTVEKIRGFLLQKPKPSAVRVFVNGEPELVKVSGSWQRLAETIVALAPELVHLLDADGNVLRAVRVEAEAKSAQDEVPVPTALATDPNAAMITHFANLIHRAYAHSTEVAFTKIVEGFDRMNERSASIEQRLERAEAYARRLRDEQADDALDRAEQLAAEAGVNSGDLGTQLATAFLSGQMNQQAAAPNGASKTNGAHKTNGKGGAA